MAAPPLRDPAFRRRPRHDAIACLLDDALVELLRRGLARGSPTSNASPRASRCARCPPARPCTGLRDDLPVLSADCARAQDGCRIARRDARRAAPEPAIAGVARAAIADEPAAVMRDGGVIAPVSTPTWTSCARSARTATPSCSTWRREARAYGDRQPARAVQPGARLLHRGHAQARPARCRPTTSVGQTLKNAERYITPETEGVRGQGAVGAGARPGPRAPALRRGDRRPAAASEAAGCAGARWPGWMR